jgi:hypothetical protein
MDLKNRTPCPPCDPAAARCVGRRISSISVDHRSYPLLRYVAHSGHQQCRQTRETSSPAGLARRSQRSSPARARLPRRGQGGALQPFIRLRAQDGAPLRPRAGAPQRHGQPRGAQLSPHRSSRGGHGGAPRGRGEARTAAGRRGGSLTPPRLLPLPTLTLGRRSLRLLERLLGLQLHHPAPASAPSLPAAGGRASPCRRSPRLVAPCAHLGEGLHRRGWTTLPRGHASGDRTTCCSLPVVWMKCFEMFQFVSPDVA